MSKKRRRPERPAIGKNEERELEKIRAQIESFEAKGQYKAASDARRRLQKKRRHFINSARWARGERW